MEKVQFNTLQKHINFLLIQISQGKLSFYHTFALGIFFWREWMMKKSNDENDQ